MKNIILISVPKIEAGYPPGSLAVISSVIKETGRHVKIFDYNVTLFYKLEDHEWTDLESWCSFAVETLPDGLEEKLKGIFVEHLSGLIDEQTEMIAFSVFSYYSARISELTCKWTRELTDLKVIAGGLGIESDTSPSIKYSFGQYLLENKLVDHVIYGEGEHSLTALLNGNTEYPGIDKDNAIQIEDLSVLPTPTYEFFDMSLYQTKKILITGSRGCVRDCTFCDIGQTWAKFKFRKADHIVNEIKKHFYEYGITDFEFTDSLINGSISNFDKFNELLYNEKQKYPELQPIKYQGQFICRPKEQMPERSYELMHLAGCNMLTVGIESFSESVRHHMRKKFSNADIDYHLEQCGRWGIPNVFLMLVGYPTETDDDHQHTLDTIRRYQKYVNSGTIFMIYWGMTMHLFDGTPIMNMVHDLNIDFEGNIRYNSVFDWTRGDNTLQQRLLRRLEIHELSSELGYPMPRSYNALMSLKKLAEHYNQTKNNPPKKIFEIVAA